MTDVMAYEKDYRADAAQGKTACWHSNHRVFADLLPGDRLWVVTSGGRVGHDDANAGYLVAVWPVAEA